MGKQNHFLKEVLIGTPGGVDKNLLSSLKVSLKAIGTPWGVNKKLFALSVGVDENLSAPSATPGVSIKTYWHPQGVSIKLICNPRGVDKNLLAPLVIYTILFRGPMLFPCLAFGTPAACYVLGTFPSLNLLFF